MKPTIATLLAVVLLTLSGCAAYQLSKAWKGGHPPQPVPVKPIVNP